MDDLERSFSSVKPQVWLIGDVSYPEFRDSVAELGQSAQVTHLSNAATAAADHTTLPLPDVVVVVESRPGIISAAHIQLIDEARSHARLVWLVGSWSESQSPGRRRGTGIERVLWHEFVGWWRSRVLRGLQLQRKRQGLIVINSPWRESAEALSDALTADGYSTLWLPRGRSLPKYGGAMAGIWDGEQFEPQERIPFLNFRRQLERDAAPLLVLMDFPRHDQRDLAIELGAAAILGKPVVLETLSQVLDELATRETRREQFLVPKAA